MKTCASGSSGKTYWLKYWAIQKCALTSWDKWSSLKETTKSWRILVFNCSGITLRHHNSSSSVRYLRLLRKSTCLSVVVRMGILLHQRSSKHFCACLTDSRDSLKLLPTWMAFSERQWAQSTHMKSTKKYHHLKAVTESRTERVTNLRSLTMRRSQRSPTAMTLSTVSKSSFQRAKNLNTNHLHHKCQNRRNKLFLSLYRWRIVASIIWCRTSL